MKFLTIGTDIISDDLFRNISDNDSNSSIKPKGGLWLTRYNRDNSNYNEWLDFVMEHPNILFYKNRDGYCFDWNCCLVDISDDAKIYNLDSDKALMYLMRNYKNSSKLFSFELLANDYDGIYIDINNLFFCNIPYNILNKFSSFGVNSLILFNTKCIDSYNSGVVKIEPFDFEGGCLGGSYSINIDNKENKKKVRVKGE